MNDPEPSDPQPTDALLEERDQLARERGQWHAHHWQSTRDGWRCIRNGCAATIPREPSPVRVDQTSEQAGRAAAVLTAREAILGENPGYGVQQLGSDEITKVADFICTGRTPTDPIKVITEEILVGVDPDGYIRIEPSALANLIRESKKKGWYEGYGQRPLFDHQGLGGVPVQCPYDPVRTTGWGDWSKPEVFEEPPKRHGGLRFGTPRPAFEEPKEDGDEQDSTDGP